jgi:CTP synthase (UTP-ammonia lyase)
MGTPVRIGIIGDYDPRYVSHAETDAAIEISAQRLGITASPAWVPTAEIERSGAAILDSYDAFWISAGSPYRSIEGALAGIRYVREGGRPHRHLMRVPTYSVRVCPQRLLRPAPACRVRCPPKKH